MSSRGQYIFTMVNMNWTVNQDLGNLSIKFLFLDFTFYTINFI